MAQLFISYAHENKEIVSKIINELTLRGYTIWFDEHLLGGTDWHKIISENVRKADVFLVILTKAALKSDWVRDEIMIARQAKKVIIPLRAENVKTPDTLISYQYVDFVNRDFYAAIADVIQAIADHVPGSTVGKSKPVSTKTVPSQLSWWSKLSPGERAASIVGILVGILAFVATIMAAFIEIVPDIVQSQATSVAVNVSSISVSTDVPVVLNNATNSPEPIWTSTVTLNATMQTETTPLVSASLPEGTKVARVPEETDSPTVRPSLTAQPSSTPTTTLTPIHTATFTLTPSPTPDLPPVLILFPETESFVIYVASSQPVSLADLELKVLIDDEDKPIKPVEDFDVLQLLDGMAQRGSCFRYLVPDAAAPLPNECANRQLLFDRRLALADVFWLDAATDTIRDVVVQTDGAPLLFNGLPVTCSTARCPIYRLENE